jgi:two-component system, OmpR family, copper resistance phosphate regulon response regulator CusR
VRLLVIEDEPRIAEILKSGLRRAGFIVDVVHLCAEAREALALTAYDAAILDLGLPDGDGLKLLAEVRAAHNSVPILILTARDAVEERVCGLDSGADDYLIKPFAFAELIARIRALLRRVPAAEPLRRRLGDLTLDLETRTVWRGDQRIDLTSREFDLLAYLLRQPGQVVTREMLAKDVWRETKRATPLDNVIDVHIAHLRRKVDDGRKTTLIQTVRGVGFVLREELRE